MKKLLTLFFFCISCCQAQALKFYGYLGLVDNFIFLPAVYNITTKLKPAAPEIPLQPILGLGIQVPGLHRVQTGYLGLESVINCYTAEQHSMVKRAAVGMLCFGVYKNYVLHYRNFSLGMSVKGGVMNQQYLYDTYSPQHLTDVLQNGAQKVGKIIDYVRKHGLKASLSKLRYLEYHFEQNNNYKVFLEQWGNKKVFSLALNVFMRPLQIFQILRHICIEIEFGPIFMLPQTADAMYRLKDNWHDVMTVAKSISIINCYVNVKIYKAPE